MVRFCSHTCASYLYVFSITMEIFNMLWNLVLPTVSLEPQRLSAKNRHIHSDLCDKNKDVEVLFLSALLCMPTCSVLYKITNKELAICFVYANDCPKLFQDWLWHHCHISKDLCITSATKHLKPYFRKLCP